ncbi:hypothetical protein LCGC14_2654900 [marine sediment metagenome]|uniref:Uncharacterized protein n=1 Tax=marine sediment metagenome TaxID=412755 RepID=A0A0F8ZTS2_9ZZZZ
MARTFQLILRICHPQQHKPTTLPSNNHVTLQGYKLPLKSFFIISNEQDDTNIYYRA